jgi:hypothetical protein
MNRLEKYLLWGILSFLNRPALTRLRGTSKSIRQICDNNQAQVLFYGIPLPVYGYTFTRSMMHGSTTKRSDIFSHLFYKNYVYLEECLKKKEDVFYDCPYASFNSKGESVESMYRCTIYNYLWNYLSLMEVAYMLQDGIAIALLKKYDRKTAHIIRTWTSAPGIKSIELLIAFNENDIIPYISKI